MKRERLLIVDDSELDLAILNEIFKKAFKVTLLSNTQTALAFVSQYKSEIAAVIVDVQLAKHSSGVTLLQKIHNIKDAGSIPVILITSDAHEEIVTEGIECGAVDFLAKPVNPLMVQERVQNIVLTAWGNGDEPEDEQEEEPADKRLSLRDADTMARRWQTKLLRTFQYRNLEFLKSIDFIKLLTQVISDAYIQKHPDCGLTHYHAELIGYASIFADVGIVALPDQIVKGGFEQPEPGRSVYIRHTVLGAGLFDGGPSQMEPLLTYCREIALYHHEEYDGTGFPSHIAGDHIPLSAQFVRAAFLLDKFFKQFALNHNAVECVTEKLNEVAGRNLDFALVDAIVSIPEQLETIHQLYRNQLN